jgi:hypothetical protein
MLSMETTSDEFRPVYVSQEDNLVDLISRVAPEDRQQYAAFRYVFTEAAFFNRKFLVVKTQGRNASGPRPPLILGSVRVVSFACSHERGSTVTLMDESTSRTLQAGHVPVKLFGFSAFVSIPVYQGLKWEAKETQSGVYLRTLVFGVCFKQKSNVKFYNKDETAVMTPNDYRKHFGEDAPRM